MMYRSEGGAHRSSHYLLENVLLEFFALLQFFSCQYYRMERYFFLVLFSTQTLSIWTF